MDGRRFTVVAVVDPFALRIEQLELEERDSKLTIYGGPSPPGAARWTFMSP